jgi:hypothetical protein
MSEPKTDAAERIYQADKATQLVKHHVGDAIAALRSPPLGLWRPEGPYKDPCLAQESVLAAIKELSKALGILIMTEWPKPEDYE